MLSYQEDFKNLSAKDFKQLVGVKPATFSVMCDLVKADYDRSHAHHGRKSKVSIEDKVLIMLKYYREYITMKSLAVNFHLAESTVHDIITHTEEVLIKSGKFNLPGRKQLVGSDMESDYLIVDGTDSPIQRPKKSKKNTTPVNIKSMHSKRK
ncbi:transposase family protein [Lactobacillus sp. ESL0791]|uniref:helix-turn-helix domain-containing protein n=1 Tax=Lactobacillus sp. ESL0791 TaxID=2983234 RepID=UPI0023F75B02|nr:transposase family protein [Lactobacillus sp. ESL0791]MDF7639009.1 transposase family protein [Lactobacillus sp. ESL0791]MDF7639016.1 transposase family protein [Lactobacillus sp. ESL0791]MDF7639272.1 transposase family protein [Lactobacillus sp. ESL0791]